MDISINDRFSFALFLALSIHALLILGISFSSDVNMPETTSIDVTLALANDLVEPEDADFIAETNQQGSGTESEPMEMTTTEQADFHNNQFAAVASQPTPTQQQVEISEDIVTTSDADLSVADLLETPTEQIDTTPLAQLDRERLVQEIASLEARIAQEQQALANMPRTKRINSASTRSAAEAAYLNAWRQKCERIGAVNYPSGRLEGQVLILVSILADGSLEEVQVLQSSGHRDLDQAALTTVRQAAPFQPFTVDMRKSYDRLEFTRWWQFTKTRSSIGS